MARARIVVDTNTLVSRLLLANSVPADAVRKAVKEAQLLVSAATATELADVLSRPKFDAYVSLADRQQLSGCSGASPRWCRSFTPYVPVAIRATTNSSNWL
jgi:predicted nucleic acid-binding protein